MKSAKPLALVAVIVGAMIYSAVSPSSPPLSVAAQENASQEKATAPEKSAESEADSKPGDEQGASSSANAPSSPAPVPAAPATAPPSSNPTPAGSPVGTVWPLVSLAVGIATVLGLIIVFKVNAFIALITAAMAVSLMAPGPFGEKMTRVASAFGSSAGSIGIVIALAAVIGQCMLDSGAADRVVRAFVRVFGEKKSPIALMGSGYVLAIPVFFDTVFYLLVPLARSLYRRTQKNYLLYILAICAGGAATHTLVPPTPGPLVMANNLGFDVGVMILVGGLVAIPSSIAGLVFSSILDSKMPIPMRKVGNEEEKAPLEDSQLPPLWESLLPVVLPVLMISVNTVAETVAKNTVRPVVVAQGIERPTNDQLTAALRDPVILAEPNVQRWATLSGYASVIGNANFALLVSTVIASWTLARQRGLTRSQMAEVVENSLMSGGVIILITAGGGAFGAMLKVAHVGDAIQSLFPTQSAGMLVLILGFFIAVLLKIAQGSSTVAMITGSAMLASIAKPELLGFHPVYLATAIGGGSLVGSWMNDSGFWIFAKMGGLTEVEALKSWSILLAILGTTALLVTLLLANVMPLA
ncbi:MAG: SLC13 family permease [Pirellulales bacterium]